MIIFISKKAHLVNSEDDLLQAKSEFSQEDEDFLKSLPIIGFDLETNDLDPYIGSILLAILGNEETQYVIDALSIDCQKIFNSLDSEKVFLGANLKFDYKFVKVKYNFAPKKMFDVMIAEQRLVQGLRFEYGLKKTAYSSALDAIVERRLGFVPKGMDKKIREEFIGVDPDKFVFENKHIHYAANDIQHLFKIREIQKAKIAERNQQRLIYQIEFPLIRKLADAELRGGLIDQEKWNANIHYNRDKRFEYQCKLDDEFRFLRNFVNPNLVPYITGGKWDRERSQKREVIQENLFGDLFEEIEIKQNVRRKKKQKEKELTHINYSSTDVLVYLFAVFQEPLPTKQKTNEIPTFVDTRLKNGSIKRKIDKSRFNFTTGEGAIESYLTENPNSPIEKFVKLLIEYRGYTTRLNTFGQAFLDQYRNRVTGRYHTIYRQCHAANSRLQSGDKKAGYFNSQNIPAEKAYREAFIADEGYDRSTTDLSGAEAVIMIDKAQDKKFYEMAIVNDDAHSPLGTAVWRNIGNYRVANGIKTNGKWKDKTTDTYFYKTPQELACINISKKENKEIRTEFKNTTFASIYGCREKKYAKMLNISEAEAKIGLKTMKQSIPKTFALVEGLSKFAQQNGYLILNTRTNSRIWYPQVFEAKSQGSDLEWSVLSEIDGSARNITISGTQADMVKEVMVEIGDDIEKNGWDAHLVYQIHDELVYDSHISIPWFPQYVKDKLCEVSNRYLSFIKISAEQHVGKSWTK